MRAFLAGAVLVPLTFATNATAVEFGLQIGRTFAVGSPELRWQGQRASQSVVYETEKPGGGYAVAASVLWPLADRFRFGMNVHAVDAGTWLFEEGGWRAVAGGVGGDIGTLELGQLDAYGAAWRVDALGPKLGGFGQAFASATYGYYRWRVDHAVGITSAPASISDSLSWEIAGQATDGAQQSAVGATLALGIEREFGAHQTFGLSISGTALSSDFTRRFLGAHLEWRWRI